MPFSGLFSKGNDGEVIDKKPSSIKVEFHSEKRIPNKADIESALSFIYTEAKIKEAVHEKIKRSDKISRQKIVEDIILMIKNDVANALFSLMHERNEEVENADELQEVVRNHIAELDLDTVLLFEEFQLDLNSREKKAVIKIIESIVVEEMEDDESRGEVKQVSDDGKIEINDASQKEEPQVPSSIESVEEIQKKREDLRIKFLVASEKINAMSAQDFRKEFGNVEPYKTKNYKQSILDHIDNVHDEHNDAVTNEERDILAFVEELNDPNNLNEYFVVENQIYKIDKIIEDSEVIQREVSDEEKENREKFERNLKIAIELARNFSEKLARRMESVAAYQEMRKKYQENLIEGRTVVYVEKVIKQENLSFSSDNEKEEFIWKTIEAVNKK